MENTLSDVEKARLPDANQAGMLTALMTLSFPLVLGQPVLADVDRIVVSTDWATGSYSIAAQPDCPRNITAALTDADNSVKTGTVTITGEDVEGNTITETMTPDGIGGGKALVGTKMFAKITSVVIGATTGGLAGTDKLVVGVGTAIGIPWTLLHAAAIRHVYLAGVRIASPVVTVGPATSSVDVSAGTYDGAKVLLVYVQPARRSA